MRDKTKASPKEKSRVALLGGICCVFIAMLLCFSKDVPYINGDIAFAYRAVIPLSCAILLFFIGGYLRRADLIAAVKVAARLKDVRVGIYLKDKKA